jgi:hypothetical protein
VHSAQDILIYHHFNNSEIYRSKIYVWMQLIDSKSVGKPFLDFHLALDVKEKIKK